MKVIFLMVLCTVLPLTYEHPAGVARIPNEQIDISRYIIFRECMIIDGDCCRPMGDTDEHDDEYFEDFCDYFNAKGPH